MPDLIGRTFGQYQILELMGRGGIIESYKAYQPRKDCYAVIRILIEGLRQNRAFVEHFARESELWAKLNHPNIVMPLEIGEEDGLPYRAEEYLQGNNLEQKMRQVHGGILSLADSINFALQIAAALDYAHKLGVIHWDVKPANIFITESGRAVLTDFYGITASFEQAGIQLKHTWVPSLNVWMQTIESGGLGPLAGTPAYVAPEQLLGEKVDHRCDLYMLGVVLYEMVTGRRPIGPTNFMNPIAFLTKPVPSPRQFTPNLPEAVERVLLKALSSNPDDRYQTAGEMIEAIQKHIVPALDADATSLNEAALRQILTQRFNLEELRTLCVDLRVSFDDLEGEGQEAKARELIAYLQRRERLGQLETYIRQHRPDIIL